MQTGTVVEQEVDVFTGKLSKDLRESAKTMGANEARYMVDMYYQVQDLRKATGNMESAAEKDQEPHELVGWLRGNLKQTEANIKLMLDLYTDHHPVGQWAKSITGIGPVISAGLLAHIDITKAPTAGHIWRFAGLDSTCEWLGKEGAKRVIEEVIGKAKAVTMDHLALIATRVNRKVDRIMPLATDKKTGKITRTSLEAGLSRRPWNANLKVLAWKIGESFVKVSSNPEDVYGRLYIQRKAYEAQKNSKGEYADQARKQLQNFRRETVSKTAYQEGRLPDGHIHARAKRWAVKLFLSHYQTVAWFLEYKQLPPKPYTFSILGHAHMIEVPNAELVPGLVEAMKRWNDAQPVKQAV